MQLKTWTCFGVAALLLGAQIVRSSQSVETRNIEANKVKADNAPMASDEVRVLSPAQSARAREMRLSQVRSAANGSGWVRVLPGGKTPAANDLTRSDQEWIQVPGKSRFGGTQLVLGRGFHSRSVATLKNNRIEIECLPNSSKAGKHQHGANCKHGKASVSLNMAR